MALEEIEDEELDALLVELGGKMDRLRALYEQYFMGIEKIPPLQVQKDVVRLVYRLQQLKIRRAEGRFRAQSLIQRYNTQKNYWQRSLREMEEGRHRTQRSKARRRDTGPDEQGLTMADYRAINMVRSTMGDEAAEQAAEERKKKRQAAVADAATDFMAMLDGGTKPGEVAEMPQPPEPEEPPASEAKPAPDIRGMSIDEVAKKAEALKEIRRRAQMGAGVARREEVAQRPRDVDREIYDRFLAERRKLNLDVDKLSFDAVKASLEKQRAKTRAKHNCARVDFDVVVKDGKAFLKPIPVE